MERPDRLIDSLFHDGFLDSVQELHDDRHEVLFDHGEHLFLAHDYAGFGDGVDLLDHVEVVVQDCLVARLLVGYLGG